LDQLSLCHIHNDILDDSLAEDNSHLGDIHHLELDQILGLTTEAC